MKGKIKIGQNKWLNVEWIVGDWWQITESHRCTEVKVGDLVRTDLHYRGLTVYASIDTPTPRHVFPSSIKLEEYGGEEE